MYLGRLFAAFAGIVALIILVILLFVGGGKKTTPITPVKTLTSYANTNAQVVMTIDGTINGDDAHRAIRVTIGQNQRQVDVIQGYSGTVIQTTPSYNTEDAYNVFLHAIYLAGFSEVRKGKTAGVDETGQCPLGQRINFQLIQNGSTLSNLWTTTCGSGTGNLGGSSQLLQELFEAQITNYQTLVEDVNLD